MAKTPCSRGAPASALVPPQVAAGAQRPPPLRSEAANVNAIQHAYAAGRQSSHLRVPLRRLRRPLPLPRRRRRRELWRGAWYRWTRWSFRTTSGGRAPPRSRSASAALRWRTRRFRGSRRRRAARGLTLYAAALSCVAAWRGVWLSGPRDRSGAASPPPATPPTAAGGGRAPPHARVGPRVARVRDRAARRGRPPHRRARAAGAHRRARGPHELGVWQAVQVFGGRRHVCEQLREEETPMKRSIT